MAGLAIQLMGPLYVTLGSQPVTSFEYDKVRALLAYLAIEQERPHRREALAGLLWPDLAEEAAESNLRNALSRLRRAINDQHADPPYLLSNREEIQFNPASDHWLDVRRFNELLDACQSHTHRRIEACPICTDRMLEAVTLQHGNFMEGFSLPDCEDFEGWLCLQREVLSRLSLDLLYKLAAAYEWRGEPEKALLYAQRQLGLDPFLEEAHVQAMRQYALAGKRAEACEQYEKCKKLFSVELGIEPMAETTQLYEQIKYGVFQTTHKHISQINKLPSYLTSFVGREQELLEINALIAHPSCRLLTLVGPGGVGKTRLAIAASSQQQATFLNGACFVPLQGVASVEGIIPAVMQALDLKPGKEENLKLMLMNYLREKELVIILDNFEHLLAGADIITAVLQNSPGIMMLVTSRQRLGVQAEWVFEVSGLSYPPDSQRYEIASFEAVKLFTQRLHQHKPRQSLFEDDLQQISRICRVVEGLPLGIELAASAVKTKTIQQVATAIESGKEELKSYWKDVPKRHRSIRAVFEHSYRMLNDIEQSAFIELGVFRSAFSADAAERVAGATPGIMDALVEHSLVRYDGSQTLYQLHELVRQFARDKLAECPEATQEVQKRHSQYYMQALNNWERNLVGPEQVIALNTMGQQLADIRAAWNWTCQIQDVNGLELGSEGLCLYYQYSSRLLEGKLDCQAALDALEACRKPDQQNLRLKVHLLAYQGNFLYRIGQITTDKLIDLLEQCLSMLDHLQLTGEDVRVDRAWTLKLISDYTPEVDKALRLAEESLLLARQAGDKRGQAFALEKLVRHNVWLGRFKEAERYCVEALAERRELSDPRTLARQLQSMSEIAGLLGKTSICLQAVQERSQLLNSLGDRVSIADDLEGRGVSHYLCSQFAEGDKSVSDCIPYLLDFGDQYKLCHVYVSWCKCKLFLGQYDAAWSMALKNNDLAYQLNYKYPMIQNYFILGAVALEKSQNDQAIDFLEKATDICDQVKISFLAGDAISTLSIPLLASGHIVYGHKRMVEGLKIGVEMHINVVIGFALPSVAYYLVITGQLERAVELLGLINEKAWCGKSPWIEDVVGKRIKEMASGLPVEVIEAAKARGKEMDLFDTAAALLAEFEKK